MVQRIQLRLVVDDPRNSQVHLAAGDVPPEVEVVVAPPYVHLDAVRQSLKPEYKVAAQNCWTGKPGAFTGEVPADMLVDMNIPWVILGHSERRCDVTRSGCDLQPSMLPWQRVTDRSQGLAPPACLFPRA